ncbi:MAG: aspartate 1-decarboxylase [Chitinispirillaceae bacterium]|jgi:aspartate 1-decarboxylase|nr:aspartate 1-decarboxylase [Chitinispirillaceae bacterium]
MQRIFLSGKIRDIRLTALRPDYEGSITLDEEYMERAGILAFEEVHVLNLNAGTRIITYAIKGKRGSGCVELNGPAARHGMIHDEIMVLSYAILTPDEYLKHTPRILSVNPTHPPAPRQTEAQRKVGL